MNGADREFMHAFGEAGKPRHNSATVALVARIARLEAALRQIDKLQDTAHENRDFGQQVGLIARAALDPSGVYDRIAARNRSLWVALDGTRPMDERRAALENAMSEEPRP